jgi:hypothetical protein
MKSFRLRFQNGAVSPLAVRHEVKDGQMYLYDKKGNLVCVVAMDQNFQMVYGR